MLISSHGTPNGRPYRACTVSLEHGMPAMLPVDRAGLMSFAPNGHTIAFDRNFRNFELRKRHVGGEQQDVYTYDLTAEKPA